MNRDRLLPIVADAVTMAQTVGTSLALLDSLVISKLVDEDQYECGTRTPTHI